MSKKGISCCTDSKKGCQMDIKVDVTKIVKCICTTVLLMTAFKCLPAILREIFILDED